MVDVDMIVRILAPAVSELGLDLYDVEVSGSGRARILRVMVDREGGVDLEAIAAATQAVSPLLDAPPLDAAIAGPYALEVSSPGLERPLRTPAHFARGPGRHRLGEDPGRRRPSAARARRRHRRRRRRLRPRCSTTAAPSTSRTATSPRRARCSSGAAQPKRGRSPRTTQHPREPTLQENRYGDELRHDGGAREHRAREGHLRSRSCSRRWPTRCSPPTSGCPTRPRRRWSRSTWRPARSR